MISTAITHNSGTVLAGAGTIDIGFTPNSGNTVVLITSAGAVQTIPGWTKQHTSLSEGELSFWYKENVSGSDSSVTYTQNGPRALAWAAWEFPPGTTFSPGATDASSNDTIDPSALSGLGAGYKVIFVSQLRPVPQAGATIAGTWSGDATEEAELLAPYDGNDGTGLWIGSYEGESTSPSFVLDTSASTNISPNRQRLYMVVYPGTPAVPDWGADIVSENAIAGSARANWFDGVGSEAIPAFARSLSNAPGATVDFSVDYNAGFDVEIYRLGYYGGSGARLVDQFAGTPVAQPAPTTIPNSNGAVTCSAWSVNSSWTIPSEAVPGWYYALLKGTNGTDFGHVLFSVSDTLAKKPVLVVSSDSTWHAAYNGFGGNNVYGAAKDIGSASDRALCSTYDKPVITRDYVPQTHFFNGEFATLRLFERLGTQVGYATIEQINADPTVMDGRQLIVFSGHNEYIPDSVMDKTKALLNAGQNFLNLAANDFFWRARFTDGAFDSGVNGRVMWCKKDTMAGPTNIRTGGAGTPFTTAADWTGTWQDSRWADNEPSWEFFGDRFIANGIRDDAIKVPESMKTYPIWRNCAGIQALTTGQEFSFGAGTAGMEWDYAYGTLNTTNVSDSSVVLTGGAAGINGENYSGSGTYSHTISVVRQNATSGIVVNFNTTQWGWAVDNFHLRGNAVASVEAQQATLNVLTDFGVSAHSASVSNAGLTMPTAIANTASAYSLPTSAGTVQEQLESLGYTTFVVVQL